MGWWIVLAIVAVVCLLIFAPVSLFLSYREEGSAAWLKVLWFLKIPLSPLPEREKKPKKAKKKKAAPPPEEEPKSKKGPVQVFLDQLQLVNDLLPHVGAAGGYILRRLTLKRCAVSLVIGEEEAADTAIAVGRAYAVAYNLYAPLCSFIRVKEFKFHVTPQYWEPTQQVAADLQLCIRPSALLAGGMLFLVRAADRLLDRTPKKSAKKRASASASPR